MINKATIEERKFIVNEEKGVVVCTIKYSLRDNSRTYYGDLLPEISFNEFKRMHMLPYERIAVGKAKCSSEDIFDPEKGKKIAESKAKKVLYNKMRVLLRKAIQASENRTLTLVDDATKYEILAAREDEHIKSLDK